MSWVRQYLNRLLSKTTTIRFDHAQTTNDRKMISKVILLAIAALELSACSKAVSWEEEVPLNNGTTIWVKRTQEYSYRGGGGNPVDIAFRPDPEENVEFTWGGRKYHYRGDAQIILLAISPLNTPVLVAPAADNGWHWNHNYKCTTPFYVQLIPTDDGASWRWPAQIEPWLIGLRYNLMRSRALAAEVRKKYTTEDRNEMDANSSSQDTSKTRIESDHKPEACF